MKIAEAMDFLGRLKEQIARKSEMIPGQGSGLAMGEPFEVRLCERRTRARVVLK